MDTSILILILALSLFVFFIAWRYKHNHVRSFAEIDEDGYLPDGDFTSINGCGQMVLGGYNIANSNQKIYYVVFCIFYLPIIPLKCMIAEEDCNQYAIYAAAKWNAKEILYCFAYRLGWVAALGVIVALFM